MPTPDDKFREQIRNAPKGSPKNPGRPDSRAAALREGSALPSGPPRTIQVPGVTGFAQAGLRDTSPATQNRAARTATPGANVQREQANQQRVAGLQREDALQAGRPESRSRATERRRTLRDLQTPVTRGGSFFSGLTQEDVVQQQRRDHLERARSENELERQAFGSTGRSADAVRSGLRTGRGRFANIIREDSLTDEQRAAEAQLIAEAEAEDAARLAEVRGLRQQDQQFSQELDQRERESQRGLQSDLINARAQGQGSGGGSSGGSSNANDFDISAQTSVFTAIAGEEATDNVEGVLRLFNNNANVDAASEVIADFNQTEVAALAGLGQRLSQATTGVPFFTSDADTPVSVRPVLDVIRQSALNPGQTKFTFQGRSVNISDLGSGVAASTFNELRERAITQLRENAAGRLVQKELDFEQLDSESQQVVRQEFEEAKRAELAAARAQTAVTLRETINNRPQERIGDRGPITGNASGGIGADAANRNPRLPGADEREAEVNRIQSELEAGPDESFIRSFVRRNITRGR